VFGACAFVVRGVLVAWFIGSGWLFCLWLVCFECLFCSVICVFLLVVIANSVVFQK